MNLVISPLGCRTDCIYLDNSVGKLIVNPPPPAQSGGSLLPHPFRRRSQDL